MAQPLSSIQDFVHQHPSILIATSFVLAVGVAFQIFSPKYDAEEPPLLPLGFPQLHHLMGVVRYGVKYVDRLR